MRHVLLSEAAHAHSGSLVSLEDEKVKHLRKVLRMDWDEKVRVIDGAGRLFEGSLEKKGSGGVIRLGEVLRSEQKAHPLELVIAMAKNNTMDWLVEKAVECGVTAIHPIVSSRSVVKPGHSEAGKYVRRWQAIMDGAVEQSERLWRPIVSEPVQWDSYFAKKRSDFQSIVFVTEFRENGQSDEQTMTDCWNKLSHARGKPTQILIGPEGGFSEQELEDVSRNGFLSVSLGSTVLRVETAVVAALTLARASRFISAV